jgi:ribonuclease P protein component
LLASCSPLRAGDTASAWPEKFTSWSRYGISFSGWMTSRTVVKGSFRFAKKARINQPQDFRTAMKFGRRVSSRNFILFTRKNKNTFHRLGIVVKKEVGPATVRNRMRRYVREFFRLHKDRAKGSYDFILLIKKGCSLNKYQEAEEELKRLFVL